MPTAELERMIERLDSDNYAAVVKFVSYLDASQAQSHAAKDVSQRIGAAKGAFVAPKDLDECNDEIAELFGVA